MGGATDPVLEAAEDDGHQGSDCPQRNLTLALVVDSERHGSFRDESERRVTEATVVASWRPWIESRL